MTYLISASAFLILMTTMVYSADAQTYIPSQEITAGIDVETSKDSRGGRHLFSGPLGRYSYNISRHAALEGSASYIAGYQGGQFVDEGHELILTGGLKAGWTMHRFGIFGKVAPGVASFDNGFGIANTDRNRFVYDRRTHFALQDGAVLEYYPTQHLIVRLDAGQTLLTEFSQVVLRTSQAKEIAQGHIAQHLSIDLSVGYRFGRSLDETAGSISNDAGKTSLGVLYALHVKEHLLETDVQANSGVGFWGDYDIGRWLSLDGAVFFLPGDDKQATYQDGGSALEAYLGPRAGFRTKHLGFFVKTRPGVIRFDRVIDSQKPDGTILFGKRASFGLDIGGVLEYYPSGQHLVVRAEGGNDLIFYGSRDVTIGEMKLHVAGEERATALFLFGAGWRF